VYVRLLFVFSLPYATGTQHYEFSFFPHVLVKFDALELSLLQHTHNHEIRSDVSERGPWHTHGNRIRKALAPEGDRRVKCFEVKVNPPAMDRIRPLHRSVGTIADHCRPFVSRGGPPFFLMRTPDRCGHGAAAIPAPPPGRPTGHSDSPVLPGVDPGPHGVPPQHRLFHHPHRRCAVPFLLPSSRAGWGLRSWGLHPPPAGDR